MRLIDADELTKDIGRTERWYKAKNICLIIDNAPTVEVDKEFIDKIRATGNFKNGYQLAKNYYKRPQGEWISVSERLPNLDDYTGSEVWQKKVLITGYLSFDDTKNLFVSEAFAKDIILGNRVHNTIVIAWQPLPEPYKEGGAK